QVLVFVHADCPTSLLALRHLAAVERGAVVVAEETPEGAVRLARRAGVRLPVVAQDAPYELSREHGIEAVPTAVLPGGERLVGWDRAAYERARGPSLPAPG